MFQFGLNLCKHNLFSSFSTVNSTVDVGLFPKDHVWGRPYMMSRRGGKGSFSFVLQRGRCRLKLDFIYGHPFAKQILYKKLVILENRKMFINEQAQESNHSNVILNMKNSRQ